VLGALLPTLLLVSGRLLQPPVLLPTLSEYYTVRPPGDFFVGVLFAYGGYDCWDKVVGKTASLSALGVAQPKPKKDGDPRQRLEAELEDLPAVLERLDAALQAEHEVGKHLVRLVEDLE
jgi:hypothetical protein